MKKEKNLKFMMEDEMENTKWVLDTCGDLEGRVRSFLGALWGQARLDGMLIPVYAAENDLPGPRLITLQNELQQASPFIPLMPVNSAKLIERLNAHYPASRFAAVLRSCEARALAEHMHRTNLSFPNWLMIGVDCLASFPQEDFSWRLERAGDIHSLTRQVLRSARQGGISTDRFRAGCQMCLNPGAQFADISIAIIGLPTKEYALVTARSDSIASKFALGQITEGHAPSWLVEQHDRVLAMMTERHQRVKQRLLAELESGLPQDVDSWISHLQNCGGCESCLEACPLYTGQLAQGHEAVAEWLAGCVSCGMCEQACPQHLPITALIRRIVENLSEDLAAV